MKTAQQQKDEIIDSLLLLKKETELIIADKNLLIKANRVNAGIKSYTFLCPICRHSRLTGCPPDCIFGLNKSCKTYFWHPETGIPKKKDFEIALDFLEFVIPELQSLPDFCFTSDYANTLRKVFKSYDSFFKDLYETPPKIVRRMKQSVYNDKLSI